ncbi:hypothetical protein H4582DRAFT_2097673 [Lactarius indigo]|nr:hypothetical protein H4582DRAFT_2097673 [Lactarius indigo]
MPAEIPMHNTLGALFIGAILSSILYGVTWLQVYSYYSSHCSRDRWPLKCFVAFLMLVDSANLVFVVYTTYHIGVTNFGDPSSAFKPSAWCLPATTLSAIVLDVLVQHFYAYRIYHRMFLFFLHLCGAYFGQVGGGSLFLPAAISVVSLISLGEFPPSSILGPFRLNFSDFLRYSGRYVLFFYLWVAEALSSTSACCVIILKHINDPVIHFQSLSIAALSCKVLCDAFIASGMVYYLLSNRTQFRKTNNVLNLLAIYSINCGTLHLAFAISSVALLAKYQDTLIYTPSLFIMYRLSLCGLNSRDNLRETLDGQDGVVVATLTQLKARTGRGTIVPSDTQDAMEASIDVTVPKSLSPHSVYSDMSSSASVIAFDREKYPVVPPVVAI